jgi:hypothetical protein
MRSLAFLACCYRHLCVSVISSVSDGLLGDVVVLLLAAIDELDGVGVLSPGERLLPLLVGDEWLGLIDLITLTVGETQMVALVGSSPDG